MAATYPAGIKTFPTYANGDQVTPTTINDPNAEITAIELGLLDGLAHNLVPDATANQRSLGDAGRQWYDLFLSHDLVVAGDLTLGDTTITGNLAVTGAANIHGGLTVDVGANVNGSLAVLNNTLTDTLTVTHLAQFNGSIDVAGDATIHGGLTLFGGANFAANILVAGNVTAATLTVNTTSTFTGLPSMNAGLKVTGTTNLIGGLDVTGDANIHGSISVGVALFVTGNTNTGTLTVRADATLQSNLFLTGAMAIGGTLFAQGQLVLNKDIAADPPTPTVVTTVPTTIYTATLVHGQDVGGVVLVTGTLAGNVAIGFMDQVLVMSDGFTQLLNGHSKGAAASRAYSWSGTALRLAMGAGSYRVAILPVIVITPGP